ncbi:MAG: aldose 1-epimerase family protein [Thermomicrobiales bacterium]
MPMLWGKQYTRTELMQHIGRLEQVAGVRLVERGDGMERGVRVLEFRTGSGFSFDVLIDRAMDIGRCEHNGRALGWQSPTGFIGPWYFEPEDLGWLRGFGGGLVTTCGLEHALFMAEDTAAHYNYPPKVTVRFGLHGRVSYLPATLTGYGAAWDGDDCTLWAEGEIAQVAMFGENLVLRRRVEATVGENRLRIHDEVTNAGWNPTPHMYLYHVNVGFPALDDGAELVIPASNPSPRGDHPVAGYRKFHGPTEGYVEQVTEHDIHAEADGSVPVAIVNRKAGFGAYEVFNQRQLPRHFIWRMLGQGTYVVGIEPSTNRTSGRLPARESGELIILGPGETRQYDLELGALPDAAAIDAFAARVAAIES